MNPVVVLIVIIMLTIVYVMIKLYREYNKAEYNRQEHMERYRKKKEELAKQYKQEGEEYVRKRMNTYFVLYICENCSNLDSARIPNGMTVKDWIAKNRPYCKRCKVEIKDNFSISIY